MERINDMNVNEVLAKSIKIGNVTICEIPVNMICADNYQRGVTDSVKRLIAEWDWKRLSPLVVNLREGKLYCIDGKHRIVAAKQLHIDKLPCIVHMGLSRDQEADLFANQNRNVKQLRPVDTFRANASIVNTDDFKIKSLCGKYNVAISGYGTKKLGRISCIARVRSIYNMKGANGVECLDWILNTIDKANWHNVPNAYSYKVINTLYTMYMTFPNNRKDVHKILWRFMKQTSPERILYNAFQNYPNASHINAAMNSYMEEIVKKSLYPECF